MIKELSKLCGGESPGTQEYENGAKRGCMTSPSHAVNKKHHLSLYSRRRTSMEYPRGHLASVC